MQLSRFSFHSRIDVTKCTTDVSQDRSQTCTIVRDIDDYSGKCKQCACIRADDLSEFCADPKLVLGAFAIVSTVLGIVLIGTAIPVRCVLYCSGIRNRCCCKNHSDFFWRTMILLHPVQHILFVAVLRGAKRRTCFQLTIWKYSLVRRDHLNAIILSCGAEWLVIQFKGNVA